MRQSARLALTVCSCQRFAQRLGSTFRPKNAVILSKLTRFEYERIRNHELDEDELRSLVSQLTFLFRLLIYC